MTEKNDQQQNTQIWDDVYKSFESGAPLGISYPIEALVVFVSNLRKGSDLKDYFADHGQENAIKKNFGGRALEIGFGSIANLCLLNDKGFETHGLEVSAEAVERGKQTLEARYGKDNGFELKTWDAEQVMPYENDYFDLVVGMGCIYYNLEWAKFENDLHRLMKDGSKFIFSFFSRNHSYIDFSEPVSKGVVRFSDKHPNERLNGAVLLSPESIEDLIDLFPSFKNVRVFTTESDQTPLFESWWYVTGEK